VTTDVKHTGEIVSQIQMTNARSVNTMGASYCSADRNFLNLKLIWETICDGDIIEPTTDEKYLNTKIVFEDIGDIHLGDDGQSHLMMKDGSVVTINKSIEDDKLPSFKNQIKHIRKEIKDLGKGYSVTARSAYNGLTHGYFISVNVWTAEGDWIAGSQGSVIPKKHMEKYRDVFDILSRYRNKTKKDGYNVVM
jgi:hypothetical protein